MARTKNGKAIIVIDAKSNRMVVMSDIIRVTISKNVMTVPEKLVYSHCLFQSFKWGFYGGSIANFIRFLLTISA